MIADASGLILIAVLLAASLGFGLYHFSKQLAWLYIYIVIVLIVVLFQVAISLQSRSLLNVVYPWGLPFLFLLPACVELCSSAILRVKSESWIYYVLFLMPIFSLVSAYSIVADPIWLRTNVESILSGRPLEAEHRFNSMLGSMTYLIAFSIIHVAVLLTRIQKARFTGPRWLVLGLPGIQMVFSVLTMCALILSLSGIPSGQLMLIITTLISALIFSFTFGIVRFEGSKLSGVISNSMFFNSTSDSGIETWLAEVDQDAVAVLLKEFTKSQLEKLSAIEISRWDVFWNEQRLSWPEFKNRIRIRYALQELNHGYLETRTVEALSQEIGFQSRKSFYTAFESVSGTKFVREAYN